MSPSAIRMVEVPGCRIACQHHEGQDPLGLPILLAHGWAGSHHTFRHLLPLAEVAPLFIPDLPGWGASDAPEASYDLDFYSKMLLGLMDALGIERVRWVGLGLGATAGLSLAVHHPDRIEAMVLASPCTWRNPYAGLRARLGVEGLPIGLGARWLQLRPALHAMLLKNHLEPELFDRSVVDSLLASFQDPARREAAWRCLRAEIDPGIERLGLSGIAPRPLTVVWGLNDRVQPLDLGRRLVAELQGAELRVIPNCGHAIPESRPRSFALHLTRAFGLALPQGIHDGLPAPGIVP